MTAVPRSAQVSASVLKQSKCPHTENLKVYIAPFWTRFVHMTVY